MNEMNPDYSQEPTFGGNFVQSYAESIINKFGIAYRTKTDGIDVSPSTFVRAADPFNNPTNPLSSGVYNLSTDGKGASVIQPRFKGVITPSLRVPNGTVSTTLKVELALSGKLFRKGKVVVLCSFFLLVFFSFSFSLFILVLFFCLVILFF